MKTLRIPITVDYTCTLCKSEFEKPATFHMDPKRPDRIPDTRMSYTVHSCPFCVSVLAGDLSPEELATLVVKLYNQNRAWRSSAPKGVQK